MVAQVREEGAGRSRAVAVEPEPWLSRGLLMNWAWEPETGGGVGRPGARRLSLCPLPLDLADVGPPGWAEGDADAKVASKEQDSRSIQKKEKRQNTKARILAALGAGAGAWVQPVPDPSLSLHPTRLSADASAVTLDS